MQKSLLYFFFKKPQTLEEFVNLQESKDSKTLDFKVERDLSFLYLTISALDRAFTVSKARYIDLPRKDILVYAYESLNLELSFYLTAIEKASLLKKRGFQLSLHGSDPVSEENVSRVYGHIQQINTIKRVMGYEPIKDNYKIIFSTIQERRAERAISQY